jgi:hypothetical protein
VILKAKRRRHFTFRTGERSEQKGPVAMSETTRIYLGTVSLDDGEKTIAFSIPEGLDPEAIKAAIEAANKEKAAAEARESARLRELFPIEDKPQ